MRKDKNKFLILNYLLLSQNIKFTASNDVSSVKPKHSSSVVPKNLNAIYSSHPNYVDVGFENGELIEKENNLFENLVTGNSTNRAIVEKELLKLQQTATPAQTDFLKLAYALPGFRITTEHNKYIDSLIEEKRQNQEGRLTSPFGFYLPGVRTLLINTAELYRCPQNELLHELLHVANHHMQLLLSDTVLDADVATVDPYYPPNNIEKWKFFDMIQEGLNNFKKLHADQNSTTHERYRDLLKNYPYMDYPFYLAQKDYKKLEKTIASFVPGNTYNIDHSLPGLILGDFVFKEMTNPSEKPVKLDIKFTDPVMALINQVLLTIARVKQAYPKELYLIELETYIHQLVPAEILYENFLRMCEYKENLFKKALEVLEKRSLNLEQRNADMMTYPPLDQHLATYFLNQKDVNFAWKYEQAEEMFLRSDAGSSDLTISYLKDLINKSYKITECNIMLAQIYYDREDYQNAAKHFKIVFKKNFDSTDVKLYYGISLYYTKQYKEAEKVLNKVVEDCDYMLTQQYRMTREEKKTWLDQCNSAYEHLAYVAKYMHPQNYRRGG